MIYSKELISLYVTLDYYLKNINLKYLKHLFKIEKVDYEIKILLSLHFRLQCEI